MTAAKAQPYLAAGRDYAPPEHPFRSVAEAGLVLGMTPELLRRLEPHVTIWSSYGPSNVSTDPVVRRAVERVRKAGGELPDDENYAGSQVLEVSAARIDANRSKATRSGIVQLELDSPNQPCKILEWIEAVQ